MSSHAWSRVSACNIGSMLSCIGYLWRNQRLRIYPVYAFKLANSRLMRAYRTPGGMWRKKGVQCVHFVKAKGDPVSDGRKSYSAKHLVGAHGLVRLRPLVPRAGQLLDLSFWARPRTLDGTYARVLWKAPYRRNSHALGDVRITAYCSLFIYALPASPASVRAGCKILDDRNRDLIHRPGGSHGPGGLGRLRQFVSVNRAICQGLFRRPASVRKTNATGLPRLAERPFQRLIRGNRKREVLGLDLSSYACQARVELFDSSIRNVVHEKPTLAIGRPGRCDPIWGEYFHLSVGSIRVLGARHSVAPFLSVLDVPRDHRTELERQSVGIFHWNFRSRALGLHQYLRHHLLLQWTPTA